MAPFHLDPGFSGYISIQDEADKEIYRQDIKSKEEADQFIQVYGKTVSGYGLLPSLFCPITMQGKDFVKDFFCPATMNFALKVNNIGLRIFTCLWSGLLDAVTFIPRALIGTPFRAIYLRNHPPKVHPLDKLLENSPESTNALRSGRVRILIHTKIVDSSKKKGQSDEYGYETISDKILKIATKKLHINQSSFKEEMRSNNYLISPDGEWLQCGYSTHCSSHKLISF